MLTTHRVTIQLVLFLTHYATRNPSNWLKLLVSCWIWQGDVCRSVGNIKKWNTIYCYYMNRFRVSYLSFYCNFRYFSAHLFTLTSQTVSSLTVKLVNMNLFARWVNRSQLLWNEKTYQFTPDIKGNTGGIIITNLSYQGPVYGWTSIITSTCCF